MIGLATLLFAVRRDRRQPAGEGAARASSPSTHDRRFGGAWCTPGAGNWRCSWRLHLMLTPSNYFLVPGFWGAGRSALTSRRSKLGPSTIYKTLVGLAVDAPAGGSATGDRSLLAAQQARSHQTFVAHPLCASPLSRGSQA